MEVDYHNQKSGIPTKSLDIAGVPESTKVASLLEDKINVATAKDYKELLRELAAIDDAVLQEVHLANLCKKLGISKSALGKEFKKILDETAGPGDGIEVKGVKTALFPGLVDLVKTDDGQIRYLIKEDKGLKLADSWVDADGCRCIPPEQKNLQFPIPRAAQVIGHYGDLDDHRLYQDLQSFFRRFSYLDEEVWPIIILSVFLSYIQDHSDVRYVPGIYFYAVAERGKSRTAKTMLATSYRGMHLLDIRPANIVRFSERLNATLFFDITDLWKSAEKSDGCDILLGRFEKGTMVPRVLNTDRGPFDDQTYFSVYGSTIFATNEPANSIFESRCLSITMQNMPGNYENLSPEMGLPYKDRLTAWRARMMDQHLPKVDPIPGISGRLWDISQPIFQLAKLVAPETFECIKGVILQMAGQKVENKRDSLEGKIVAAIDSLVKRKAPEPWEVPVEEIRAKVNATVASEQYHHSSQKIGRRIQSLSIESKKVNGTARVVITARELDVLKEQHGLIDPNALRETLQLATTRQNSAYTPPDGGRELLESFEPSANSPEADTLKTQTVSQAVESGGELQKPPAQAYSGQHEAYLSLLQGDQPETGATGEQRKSPTIEWKRKPDQEKSTDQPTRRPIIQWRKG